METNIKDIIVKLLLIGDSRVGKTCILNKYIDDKFATHSPSTIGIDFRFKKIPIDGQTIKLQLWDTAGQERFQAISYSYFKDAHGVLIIFDLNDKQSFDNVERWIKIMDQNEANDVLKVLVGNKCDLEMEVQRKDIDKLCAQHKLVYFEISAKTGDKINEPFEYLARTIKKHSLDKMADSILNMKDSTYPRVTLSVRSQRKDENRSGGKCCE